MTPPRRVGVLALPLVVLACAAPPGRQLCEAIGRRDLAAVRRIVTAHEMDFTRDQGGCMPAEAVFGAATSKDGVLTAIGVELVKAGLPPDASWPSPIGGRRTAAVEVAAAHGNLELVRALVAVGVDLKSVDATRALVAAAGGGHLPVVRFLVEEGVDPAAAEADTTAALRARAEGHTAIVEYLEATLAERATKAAPTPPF